ncbi:MAG TPA: hypothetical protein VGD17_01640 [Chitinophagaceae bacterium]
MKKIFLLSLLSSAAAILFAQKQTYDLVSYTPPAGWKKEVQKNLTSYTITDKKNNTWCQIFIVKSTVSKGSIEADFASEWQELAVKNYNPSGAPVSGDIEEAEGWKIKAGAGKFVFNNSDAMVMVTTFSGYDRCVSLVFISNNDAYMKEFDALLGSLELQKPDAGPQKSATNTSVTGSGFAFNTTNFDDGWTSTIQEDWVEVTKGNLKVLLHYPKDGTIFPADPEPLTTAAWNILVAPRYSNLKNYKTAYITTFNRPYLGMGYATEKATGKNIFIVLFRQGQSGWLEFIAPDKNSFIQQFKFDPESIQWDSNADLMIPLLNMTGYNKFAVAASDLKGKWTSDFTGIQQMYSVYTGQYAGMNINQSNEEFTFNAGNAYSWKLLAVNGMVGNLKFAEVKSTGQFTVPNNWQVHFSKIEDRARTFHAFWSCIKGARILNLLDAGAPGSGIYTKYGLAK